MDNANTDVTKQTLGHSNALPQERTYNFINNNTFYSLLGGTQVSNYYWRIIKPSFEWYDGYYEPLHKSSNGIFSTRIAKAIISKLASQINGGTAMFDVKDLKQRNELVKGKNAKQFIQDWSSENNFSNQLNTAIEWSLVGGDTLMKLNYDGKDFSLSKHRKDTYLVDSDFAGHITGVKILIYNYLKTTGVGTPEQKDYNYYLLEERKYDKNHNPIVVYSIKRGIGQRTQNKGADVNPARTINFKDLPADIRTAFKNDFPTIKLGKEIPLHFNNHLGVYLLKSSESVTNLPDLPYGEGEIPKIFSQLMSYDYYYSSMNTDMYIARGRVLVPKGMQGPQSGFKNYNTSLDSMIYQKISYGDPNNQKPEKIQFELRSAEWTEVRNHLLENIATNINVSVRTIAEYLNDSTNQTAREISQEEDATILYVENKRSLYKQVIDRMIKDILDLYGYSKSCVVIRFSKVGLTNMNNLVTQVTTMRNQKIPLIDLKSALEVIHIDKDDQQIEKMMKNILKEVEEERVNEINNKMKELKSVDQKEIESGNTDINHTEKPKK
jgi:hypothetical protein